MNDGGAVHYNKSYLFKCNFGDKFLYRFFSLVGIYLKLVFCKGFGGVVSNYHFWKAVASYL